MPDSKKPFIVGLTGGIACGKSLVSNLFASHGIPIINADHVAHSITQQSTPCYNAIVEHFGESILNANHEINRGQLKERIFKQAADKKWLENLLHPVIWRELERMATTATSSYVILEIPLLVEANSHPMIDRILLVDAPPELQIQRVIERDNIPPAQAEAILSQQASREERMAVADDIIVNDGEQSHLTEQVENLHHKYTHCDS